MPSASRAPEAALPTDTFVTLDALFGADASVAAAAPTSHRARARKAEAPRPEPVPELGILEFGKDDAAIHLPGVFRLDVGRRGRAPGPDDVVAPTPERREEPAQAPSLAPGIPRQSRRADPAVRPASGRHARTS